MSVTSVLQRSGATSRKVVRAHSRSEGSADVELFIDPSQRIIGFRTAAGDLTPDLARFDFITFRTVLVGESRVDELSIRAPLGGVEEAYSWMCAVIDRVQHDQVSAGAAVLSSLAALEGVLAKQVALSREKLIGLFGEIFFPGHLDRGAWRL